MTRFSLTVLSSLALATLLLSPAHAMTLYVSPMGNDNWSGQRNAPNPKRSDGPFATLTRARDQIRTLKAKGKLPKESVTVELAGGVYELGETFALDAQDAGTMQSPITYRARKGQTARLVGGKQVTGWSPLTDKDILARLAPEARGKVMQANLHTLGLGQLPGPQGGANWGQSSPGVELFFQDRPMTLARWPNGDVARVADVVDGQPVDDRGTRSAMEGKIVYEGDRPARWVGEKDVYLHGFWAFDWADQRQKVEAIDPGKHTITLAKPDHAFGYRNNQWFYAFNILAELDQPGEWYLDHDKDILYFWPTAPLNQSKVLISVLPTLVSMKDVSHVTFSGLTLEAARGTALTVEGGSNIRVSGCTIRNVGSWAVRMTGTKDSGVVGCDLSHLGEGGIDLDGGDRKTLTPGNLSAENNHIHHYSRWNPVYNAAVRVAGVANRVRHNLIHDAPHLALELKGNDHLVEFNEVHNVLEASNDAGILYAWNNWSMRGNVIRHNYFHHVYGRRSGGCMGVYLDDNFSSALVFGNVFNQVPRAAFIGGGRDNVVENNLFIDCDPAVNVDARGLEWRANGKDDLTKKLEEMPYQSEPWRSRYPQLLTLLSDDPMAPKGTLVTRNVRVGGRWTNIERAAIPYVVQKDNFTDGDPLFVDAAHGNYALRKESPVWKLGFKAIPMNQIGLQAGPERASWPVVHPVHPKPAQTASTP